jgi:hypothetical protein
MNSARHTKTTNGRVTTHLPAALVLCASVAAPLATAAVAAPLATAAVAAPLATADGAADATIATGPVAWAGNAPVVTREAPVARPVFVRAERGPSATVRGADGRVLGWTRDQVLDAASGIVTHVVLETAAGRTVAIASTRFAWDPYKKELWLAAGPAELSESSDFDPAELQRLEGPAWNVAGVFQAGRIPSTSSDSSHSVLASTVAQGPVTVAGRVVGSVDALLLDPQRAEVAYVLVTPRLTTSGEEPVGSRPTAEASRQIPVPWSALTPGDGGTVGCSLAPQFQDLASAPSVPADLHPLGNLDFLATVNRFWRTTGAPTH